MGSLRRARKRSASVALTVSRSALLPQSSDRAFREFVHGLLAFSARLQAIRDRFGELIGLTGIQYTILISIRHLESDGEVTVKAVADHLRLSGAFITIETGKLLQLGLISKVQDFRDRRRVRLSVSRRGQERLATLARVQAPVNDKLFEFLTADEFRALAARMDQIVDSSNRALALLDYLGADPKPAAAAKNAAIGRR